MYESDTFRYWWSNKKELHTGVFQYLEHLDQSQGYRSNDNLKFMRLYGNYEMLGLDSYSYNRTETSYNVKHRVTLNIVQSMVDTVVSKVAKNKPKPTFLTEGGDWSLQRRAKKLTKFCEGIFSSSNMYDEGSKAFQDACIFGTGFIKIYKQNGNIKAERVFTDEIKVDDAECLYGKPRQMHQIKYIHRDVLKAMFPGNDGVIDMQTDTAQYGTSNYSNAKDMVRVIESWKLPSGKNKQDGVHCITIREHTLFQEDYTKDYFPFVYIKWTQRPVGFFGQGMAEQLQGIQMEINKILRTIQVSMHLTSIPKVFVEASSKVVTAHLNNKIGGIVKYAGTKPSYESVGTIPGELFSHLDRLYNRAYEIAGVSQLSARSLKPAGLDSGKALREFNDIESERFLEVGKRYERMYMDAARIMIDMARDCYQEDPEFNVKAKGKGFIETIKWEDVDMEEDKFMMDIFPTSSLSTTPAGRLQDVQELLQAGFISKEDGMKLLDFPDLEQANSLYNADIDNIERQIESMIDDSIYEPPEPYQNLDMAKQKAQMAYLKYRSEGAPEENLELLRRYMEDCQDLLEKAEAAAMQAEQEAALAAQAGSMPPQNQVMPAEAPIAQPEAAPTSDLLPVEGQEPPIV
jgi:hypothetical protein